MNGSSLSVSIRLTSPNVPQSRPFNGASRIAHLSLESTLLSISASGHGRNEILFDLAPRRSGQEWNFGFSTSLGTSFGHVSCVAAANCHQRPHSGTGVPNCSNHQARTNSADSDVIDSTSKLNVISVYRSTRS